MPSKDADLFFQNLITLLKDDATIKELTARKANGDAFVSPSKYVPVGNKYPQITLSLNDNESESVIPAGRYNLMIRYWLDKAETQVYSKSQQFKTRIDELLNRKANSLNDISVSENIGVRVAFNLRRFAEESFDREHNKYFVDVRYDLTLSENESFADADAGNKPWI